MISEPKTKSQTLQAVDVIRDLIFQGELAAGTDHLETELAARLGMSRTPVREATLILEARGMLDVRPRKGVRILSLSVQDMDEIYAVLTELESLASSLAASAQHSEEELTVLSQTLNEMEHALTSGDRKKWAACDATFHREIIRLAGNSRIAQAVSNFNDQVHRARAMTLHLRPMPIKSLADHQALLEAIRSGDANAAHNIHRAHRKEAHVMMLELLELHGLKRV